MKDLKIKTTEKNLISNNIEYSPKLPYVVFQMAHTFYI